VYLYIRETGTRMVFIVHFRINLIHVYIGIQVYLAVADAVYGIRANELIIILIINSKLDVLIIGF